MIIENKTNTKAKILKRVLPLFLVNNYEAVTIALMEDATSITRGTIYRYFDDKKDIFNQAVVQYYNSSLNVLYALDPRNHTLETYWKLKIRQLESSYEYLQEYGIFADMLAISHYVEVQATRVVPSFNEMTMSHRHRNLKYWSFVLKNTPGFTLDTKNMTYKKAWLIYHGLYLQLCSHYPKIRPSLPEIVFPDM